MVNPPRSKNSALFGGVVQREGAGRKKYFLQFSREGRGYDGKIKQEKTG
jgi:hypothetical protein